MARVSRMSASRYPAADAKKPVAKPQWLRSAYRRRNVRDEGDLERKSPGGCWTWPGRTEMKIPAAAQRTPAGVS